jgi:predicted protein tyrosine phosphatase
MQITVSGFKKVPNRLNDGDYRVLISIGTPDGRGMYDAPHIETVEKFRMWDAVPSTTTEERPLACGTDILRLIRVAREVHPKARVVVHGSRGQSRAPAAAIVMLVAAGEKAARAVRTVCYVDKEIKAGIQLNGWILAVGGLLLGVDIKKAAEKAGVPVKW